MNSLAEKEKALRSIIKHYKQVIVAFSGGVDSSFLLYIAHQELGNNVLGVTAVSDIRHPDDLHQSIIFCKKYTIPHEQIKTHEMMSEHFVTNLSNRCYYCKKIMCQSLQTVAKEKQINNIVHAINYDDLNDYRPGIKAADEMNIKAPLVKANMSKSDIRLLSKKLNLDTWHLPSQSCLATRIPYGIKITIEDLTRIQKSEQLLSNLGFKVVRVRCHGDVARIEVATDKINLFLNEPMKQHINQSLQLFGFKFVTLDLQGYSIGRMNETIHDKNKNINSLMD